jgi:hypothetical protein
VTIGPGVRIRMCDNPSVSVLGFSTFDLIKQTYRQLTNCVCFAPAVRIPVDGATGPIDDNSSEFGAIYRW